MKKRLVGVVLAAALTFTGSSMAFAEDSDYVIATVPKLTAAAWFVRMEDGIKNFADDTGVDAYMTGPGRSRCCPSGTVHPGSDRSRSRCDLCSSVFHGSTGAGSEAGKGCGNCCDQS